jgi:hypothetical protein
MDEEGRSIILRKLGYSQKDGQIAKSVLPGNDRVPFSECSDAKSNRAQLRFLTRIKKTSEGQGSTTSCKKRQTPSPQCIRKEPICTKASQSLIKLPARSISLWRRRGSSKMNSQGLCTAKKLNNKSSARIFIRMPIVQTKNQSHIKNFSQTISSRQART